MIILRNKLLWCFIFICLIFFSKERPIFSVENSQAATTSRVIRVGIYENKPKIFRDENGKVTGLYGDLLEYIAKQEDWQMAYVDGTFDEGLSRLETGEIDMMVDVALSDERIKKYDFNQETVFGSWGVLYVRKNSDINSYIDLNNKKIAILKSSIYRIGNDSIEKYIKAFNLKINFVERNEYSQVFDLLSKGEVDAAIVSRISGLTAEKTFTNLKATDIIFSPTELRFALTKGDLDNAYIIERLDFWIKRLRDGYQGIYEQILKKNGLSDFREKVMITPSWVYPSVVGGVIALLIAGIIIFGFNRARNIAARLLAKKDWYLRKVIGNVPVIISALDKNGTVIFSEGKNRDQSGFELFNNNETIARNIQKVWLGQEVIFEIEIEGRIYKILSYPVLQKGRIVEATLVSIDITEESLLNKSKKEFIYIVQHQLRTPPTIIKWGLDILEPKVMECFDEDEKKNWKMIDTANKRMINLANIISRISEMESGLFPSNPETFDLLELIEEIIREFNKIIKERKLKINTRFDGKKKVLMDKTIMDIVVQTLISNAIHYTAENGFVNISIIDNDNSLIVKVEDNGFGISGEIKDKIYAPFSRGVEASRMYPEGVGVGLYTTKVLLDNINGKIWYESKIGKGSTFFVEIPKNDSN